MKNVNFLFRVFSLEIIRRLKKHKKNWLNGTDFPLKIVKTAIAYISLLYICENALVFINKRDSYL